MSAKVLKPATIIPRELYVDRDADRQLHRVLEDMGRPGYVLVARQMGKTNLLLHAKRVLQSDHDVFVYLDLSGAYRSAQECFRAIIDTALETHPHAFAGVVDSVARERGRRDLPAHKEHEAELRLLLSAIRGKIVIILDEIDALTRCDYSDQIFSQIRSTYFARINFSEYGRLTYVLSGVAEPAEIIKNPNLSPFNIGEKIYLDDFTREEFEAFVGKAGLALSEEVKAHVFDWTSGNPRITWDICSELENQMLDGRSVTKASVDAAVAKLYLNSFDKPPVDHIRTLVENDKIIRNAIVQLRYGKGNTLSDSVRSRLYLAGIVKSDVRNIQIKNRVIDASLSDQWLRDIDVRRVGVLSAAIDLFNNSRHADALVLFRDYLDGNPDDPQGRATAHSYLGLMLRRSGEYKEAISHLETAQGLYDKVAYSAAHYERAYQLGLCHAQIGNMDVAIQYLEQVASSEPGGEYYYAALVTLAAFYQSFRFEQYEERALELNQRVIKETPTLESRLGRDAMRAKRTAARFSLVKHYERLKDESSAKRVLDEALNDIPVDLKPRMLLEYCRIESDQTIRASLLRQISDVVLASALEVKAPHAEVPLAFDTTTFNSILLLAYSDAQYDVFQRLMEHSVARSSNPNRKRAEQLYALAASALVARNHAAGKRLAAQAFESVLDSESVDRAVLTRIVTLNAALSAQESELAFEKFLECFQAPDAPASLDQLSVIAFMGGIRRLQRAGLHRRVIDASSLALSRQSGDVPVYTVMLEYLAMRSHHVLGNLVEEKMSAAIIRKLSPELVDEERRLNLLSEKALSGIISSAEKILREAAQAISGGDRRIGRNDRVRVRYQDGQEVIMKFKKVETDLKAGKCVLVDDNSSLNILDKRE